MRERYANLNQLAQSQHSVFTKTQARDLGFSDKEIRTNRDTGRWIHLQQGLYRLGGAPFGVLQRLSAALLALPQAVASHESAAHLHGVAISAPLRPVITLFGTTGRSAFAQVHRYDGLHPDDVVVRAGLPVTSAPLTLFHLSTVISEKELGRVVDSCLRERLATLPELHGLADYWTRLGRPRRSVMRRILLRREGAYVPAESVLESAFMELVGQRGLPSPMRQFRVPWLEHCNGRVDFAYPTAKLIVEVDGRAWHTRDADFARDRERDRQAQLAGWMTLRYTWAEVTQRKGQVAGEVRHALTRRAAA